MKEKLPVGRLSRLTWLQTGTIGFIFYLLIAHSNNPHAVGLTFLTISGVLMVGYADIGLMLLISKYYSIRSRKFTIMRRFFSYVIALLIYQALRPAFSFAGGEHWTIMDLQSLLVFTGSGIVINTLITMLHDSVLLYEHKMYSELELSRLSTAHAEVESVFTVLAIHNQISPPTINIFNQDPECDLDYVANTARDMKIDVAVKNNFGFGGTNGTLVFRRV